MRTIIIICTVFFLSNHSQASSEDAPQKTSIYQSTNSSVNSKKIDVKYDSDFLLNKNNFLKETGFNISNYYCNKRCSDTDVLIITFTYNNGKNEKYLWTTDSRWVEAMKDRVRGGSRSEFDWRTPKISNGQYIVRYDENNQIISLYNHDLDDLLPSKIDYTDTTLTN